MKGPCSGDIYLRGAAGDDFHPPIVRVGGDAVLAGVLLHEYYRSPQP